MQDRLRQAAMAAGDIAAMQRLAHQLHGGAASIGATDLAMKLEEAELRCKQGELEQARQALSDALHGLAQWLGLADVWLAPGVRQLGLLG